MAAYSESERLAELRAFDATKAGVKGLVDAGFTSIPASSSTRKSSQPPARISKSPSSTSAASPPGTRAARRGGGGGGARGGGAGAVPRGEPRGAQQVLDEMLERVRGFHEEGVDAKGEYYTRDLSRKVVYNCNFDLFRTQAANWRDTLSFSMAPDPPRPEELPLACRDIAFKYASYVQKLGTVLLELLSESLGLNPDHLIKNGVLGGLQVLRQNQWLDVPPVPGSFIVNMGDLLQLVSNDKLKSVEHRVVAKSSGPEFLWQAPSAQVTLHLQGFIAYQGVNFA
uniref:Isopenicillin N synthase-like Fe(2+) 2OG dioxygenase domain-containing protein n=1 Tax=Ananas comosus var. bracteatus TaxID=296719 RepID=A0A6V7NK94_ANACO|nr:unnamed protein product [Ananas comosus var. bracteatus]